MKQKQKTWKMIQLEKSRPGATGDLCYAFMIVFGVIIVIGLIKPELFY